MINIDALHQSILQVAKRAGTAILDVYQTDDFGVETKADESPLTKADLAAHDVIASMLKSITPKIPVVSEEDQASLVHRTAEGEFWLIDPLDGTKEFVARNGEFTVNIALIRDGRAVWGVVYAPVRDLLYWGGFGLGAWVNERGAIRHIECVGPVAGQPLKVVASKSHLNERTQLWIQQLGDASFVQAGSSLKLCQVASGEAHVYPRLAPTCEWDTAAAQAVVEGAGGWVTDLYGEQMRYGKAEILNPDFIVSAIHPSKLPKI
ncbi:3'(2'),5'-bisphosphate nucleotidase CysQ [Burkholderiaceae bacterium]|nr:3'(2'),5'-bisphosphate nucleotidase CysQ [Burkholderiaceae bacterium]